MAQQGSNFLVPKIINKIFYSNQFRETGTRPLLASLTDFSSINNINKYMYYICLCQYSRFLMFDSNDSQQQKLKLSSVTLISGNIYTNTSTYILQKSRTGRVYTKSIPEKTKTVRQNFAPSPRNHCSKTTPSFMR